MISGLEVRTRGQLSDRRLASVDSSCHGCTKFLDSASIEVPNSWASWIPYNKLNQFKGSGDLDEAIATFLWRI